MGPEGEYDGARMVLQLCSEGLTEVTAWQSDNGKTWFEYEPWKRVLDVSNGDTNTTPQIWGKGLNDNQKFDLVYRNGGFLIRTTNGNKCLDITGGDYSQYLQWYPCAEDGNPNQLFTF